jgi:serine protease Do
MKLMNPKSGKLITFLSVLTILGFIGFSTVSTSSTQPNSVSYHSTVSHHNKATDWKKSIVQIHVQIGEVGMAAGAGWVLSADGIIITNFHVVEHDTNHITVIFEDGTSTKATYLGGDKEGDVAVIKVDTKHEMIPLELGDSSKLEVGDQLTIIGNPLDMGITVTRGIVSNPLVYFPEFPFGYVQTDSTINPGNSGGVMLDSEGRFVAMTALLAPGENGGNSYGFGISINDIEWSLVKIAAHVDLTRASLAIKIKDSTDFDKTTNLNYPNGVLVVDSANPMLLKNDLIVKINGKDVKEIDDLHSTAGKILLGEHFTITVMRSGKPLELHMEGKLLKFPEPKIDAVIVPAPTLPKSLPPTPDQPNQKSN